MGGVLSYGLDDAFKEERSNLKKPKKAKDAGGHGNNQLLNSRKPVPNSSKGLFSVLADAEA